MRYYASDDILEEFYENLLSKDSSKAMRVHIPRSDVFYVRMKYFNDTGDWITLDRMERSMYLEGMLEAADVLDPERKRDWE